MLQRNVPLQIKEYYLKKHTPRTQKQYVMANSTDKRDTIMPDVLETNKFVTARALSFINHSTGCLLELKAFDPEKVTLIEIFHAILLGIAKYLSSELVKKILKMNPEKLKRLANSLKEHVISTGLSHKFIRLLKHSEAFLGLDFKMLLQIFAVALLRDFSDDQIIGTILPCFVDSAVNTLTAKLHAFDEANVDSPKHTSLCNKPKAHKMTHLTEDIRRFGPALNFEMEKDNQFNKHICEHLIYTN
ncbi:hypothetical protein PHYBLDRAFT_151908 [Phycomyces blakesleeanus NRRL 1555(-)]|uniref:Uncharacterized protein n=1 Tax=Phycomyces blakesleeanus (strain ATCC 8743b / DSM 1359 / FGSC 10004 / NBRC 33097 / NRRL 1555) TaxID=763407 RepID=A0A167JZC1_PHYB8|nr:hypothetical protein PHYBLDRAFT_151908 [Phycomyces blakesleeanus NRRL 1555(-)]OAD66968.1 hypothetical protein PHYBLDRAFT_151908 [Phycomyces blakesleeanus NRRL 1555(-)]|eukprot:XP_018285008.1 hypothetical protein PHYBLDRAFT_151908 [Phycomyces blakesleeanus NRRL 1555(-)]